MVGMNREWGTHWGTRKWEDPEKPRSRNNRHDPDLRTQALNQGIFSEDDDENAV